MNDKQANLVDFSERFKILGNESRDAMENRCTQEVFGYYSQVLPEYQKAHQFLRERSIDDLDLLSSLGVGFADRTLGLKLSEMSKYEEQATRGALQRCGLLKSSGHEFFRGALVFPFYDESRRVVAAYGRRITEKLRAKSYYHLHWNSKEACFFNLQALEEEATVILCKNPLEAVVWLSFGFSNTVALMGARAFSNRHVATLKNLGVNQVYIAFGTTREELIYARKICCMNVRHGISSRILVLPSGLDACDHASCTVEPGKSFQQAYNHPFVLD